MNAVPNPLPAGTAAKLPSGLPPHVDWLHQYLPYAVKGGIGLVIGFVLGFLLRQAMIVGLIFLGLLFIIFQAAAHYGVITINWHVIQGIADPEVAGAHMAGFWKQFYQTATFNLPYAGGFVPGLLLGLRRWRG